MPAPALPMEEGKGKGNKIKKSKEDKAVKKAEKKRNKELRKQQRSLEFLRQNPELVNRYMHQEGGASDDDDEEDDDGDMLRMRSDSEDDATVTADGKPVKNSSVAAAAAAAPIAATSHSYALPDGNKKGKDGKKGDKKEGKKDKKGLQVLVYDPVLGYQFLPAAALPPEAQRVAAAELEKKNKDKKAEKAAAALKKSGRGAESTLSGVASPVGGVMGGRVGGAEWLERAGAGLNGDDDDDGDDDEVGGKKKGKKGGKKDKKHIARAPDSEATAQSEGEEGEDEDDEDEDDDEDDDAPAEAGATESTAGGNNKDKDGKKKGKKAKKADKKKKRANKKKEKKAAEAAAAQAALAELLQNPSANSTAASGAGTENKEAAVDDCAAAKYEQLVPAIAPGMVRPLLPGQINITRMAKAKRSSAYEAELAALQVELVKLQAWVKHKGLKVVVIFEGRDAAGKGGVIKRVLEKLNPRICRVVALGTPTERERTQWYFQRYISHLPAAGEIVLFDRSWYNRAGVERVMDFCSDEEYREFMHSCPIFEEMIIRSGILLLKYWFSVSDDVQEKRFQSRMDDSTKRWKLSPMDIESRNRWVEYSKAKDDMLKFTDSDTAPWVHVHADNKKLARYDPTMIHHSCFT